MVTKIECPYGCGKEAAPGPMKMHQRACPNRPEKDVFTIVQPKAVCRYCGFKSTAGAVATHEKYGCAKRPMDGGDARVTCEFCGKVRTMPGAMVRHYNVCIENPANPQKIGHLDQAGNFERV